MLNQVKKYIKLNPIALIAGCFFIIPGVLVGQVLGVTLSLFYTPLISLLGGVLTGSLGYLFNINRSQTPQSFYRALTVALSVVLGVIWGGTTLGPLLFFVLPVFSTILSMTIGMSLGMAILGSITFALTKLFSSNNPRGLMILASGISGLTLLGCIGFSFGPVGWVLCVNAGMLAGIGLGVVNSLVNKSPDAAKVLSSIFSMSSTLIGAMLGAIIGSVIPFVSAAYIGSFFGISCLFAGVLTGHVLGKGFTGKLDLANKQLVHKVYQTVFLMPTIFMGYLAGGVVGLSYLPVSQILLAQAVGMIVASASYTLALSLYYVIRDSIVSPNTANPVASACMSNLSLDFASLVETRAHRLNVNLRQVYKSNNTDQSAQFRIQETDAVENIPAMRPG